MTIIQAPNGPLLVEYRSNVKGAVEVDPSQRHKVGLWRCGLSENKPFCDGSHYDAKGSDENGDQAD